MKKFKLLLPLLVCGLTTFAQDQWWGLANNYILNTATETAGLTTQALTPSGGFSFDGTLNIVLNSNAQLLMTGSGSNFSVSPPTGNPLGQVFPIANSCHKFLALQDEYSTSPLGNALYAFPIDCSGVTNTFSATGFPTPGSDIVLHSGADGVYYGAVAAKMNVDGTRYIYYIDLPAGASTSTLYRYTVSASGTFSGSTVLTTTLPKGSNLHISPDGVSLGYISAGTGSVGNFTTYNLQSGVTTTYTIYTDPAGSTASMVEVTTIAHSRKWFINSNYVIGYVIEGSASSWVDLSAVDGFNSNLEIGQSGDINFASSVAGHIGQLRHFNPNTITQANFSTSCPYITNAFVNVKNGGIWSFGNHVEGEDVCNAGIPATPGFTVEGLSQTSTPPLISQCPLTTTLHFIPTVTSYYQYYSIYIEEGTYAGGVFTAGPIHNAPTSMPAPLFLTPTNLFTLLPALNGYSGYFRVTYEIQGPCRSSINSQVFQLQQATASIDFGLAGPSSCSGPQPRNPTASFPFFTQPVSLPPCQLGWLGDASCGLTNATISTTGGYDGYNIQIEQYSATGTDEGSVANYTAATGTLPFLTTFNSITTATTYFYSNYSTIKNNKYFKVTLSVNSAYCGALSTFSYFKIIDGGSATPFWRTTNVNQTEQGDAELTVYPNPSTDVVNFKWFSDGSTNASVQVFDVYGKVVLQESVKEQDGENMHVVDMSKLPTGVYMYKFSCEKGLKTGKIQKL